MKENTAVDTSDISSTAAYIAELEKENKQLKFDKLVLQETVKKYQDKLFGKKSEKMPVDETPNLFNEAELESPQEEKTPKAQKIKVTYERLKKAGRKPLPADLPRIEKIIDLSPEEKSVYESRGTLTKIDEDVNEKLEIIPQKINVIREIKIVYSFKEKNAPKRIITAGVKPQLIPHGIATASSAAYVLTGKFVDSLPYYRQEEIFRRLGIDLSRQTMCDWQIYLYYNYLSRLIDLMKADLKKSYLIGADETSVLVVCEEGKPDGGKSYMWVYRGYQTDKKILLFDYQPNRRGINPRNYLDGYSGYLQSDGFDGYNLVVKTQKIKHLGCWAHARRKFFDCFKGIANEKYPESKVILEWIQTLYAIEKEARSKELSYEELLKLRQEKSKPVLDTIYAWLKENVRLYPPSVDMGKAINYALNQWNHLTVYLEDGRLPIDNNLVENAIRPFVIGRKNWLFSYTANGADSSAAIYSLVETAKANGKEPFAYLNFLLENIPSAKNDDDYRKLLPY
jgi:transposase